METGATVPGYSGGVAACSSFCSRGLASKPCVGNRRMKDVAWGPNMETGATVPGYSGGVAACTSFCSRGWALKPCVGHRRMKDVA
jgi:hypothetical protein